LDLAGTLADGGELGVGGFELRHLTAVQQFIILTPVSLLALVIAVGGAMLIVVLANYVYRASLHLSSTTGIMTALGLTFGIICIVALPLILLLGYARYRMGEHNVPQMLVGSAIGIGCALGVFYGLGV